MNETVITVKDSRKYKTLVTDKGNAKIALAVLNGEKINVTTAVVGDGGGTYYSPTPDMTALKHEVWRGDIANKEINAASANMVDVKIVLDGSVGGFTVREIGLLDADGDLIAICNTPDTEKAVILDGIAATLTLIMHVVFTNVDAVEFQIDPSVDNISAADMEAAIKKHNADPNAHGGAFPIYAGVEKPESNGSFLWLQVIRQDGDSITPEEPGEVDAVTLDIQPYHKGGDLYVEIDNETKSVENAERQTADEEPLKIKLT